MPALGVPALVQLPGTAGCVSETGTGGVCSDGAALLAVLSVAVSPDGRNVYAASADSDALVVFDRDPASGELTQKAGTDACISETGTGGDCTDGVGLDNARSVAVSPDGRNLYVASFLSDAVAVFDRDPATGGVSQKAGTDGCISEDGTGGACTDGVALSGPFGVTVSPDGMHVYVVSRTSAAVSVFDRDPATGELTQKAGTDACISLSGTGGACVDGVALSGSEAVAVSPDGRNVYVAAIGSDAVAVFDRDPETGVLTQKAGTDACVSETGSGGACADGVALDQATGLAVSPDGRSVYVVSFLSDAVAVFDRDATTGVLTQKAGTAACVSEDGTGGACTDGVALDGARSVAVSADGHSLYVASQLGHAVAAFDRDATTGVLTQKAGPAACVSEDGTGGACTDGVALDTVFSVTVSPDTGSVYSGASGASDAVAVFTRDVPTDDIDGDGAVEALIDGLLQLRYFFGFRGAALVTGAVDLANCTRCTAAEIEAYIQALLGM